MIRLFSKRKLLELAKFPANTSNFWCSSVPAIHHRNFSSEMSSLVGSPNSASVSSSRLERLKFSERPKMVRQFLQNCSFSDTQVDSIVSRWPMIQRADPEKTLKPKIDYFHSRRLTEEDVIKIVCAEPWSLARSLEKHVIPLFDLLRSVVGSEENVARVMKNYPFIFRCNVREALECNLATLRECGVPDSEIAKLIFRRPQAITPQPSRFVEAIARVKELGFDPAGPRFGIAITVIGWCSKASWEGKMQTLRSYGLSDKEIFVGFRILPLFMMLKQPNIKAKMDFFVKTLNWSPSKLMVAPSILMCSLEERIICRLSVLHCLASKGLVKDVVSVQLFLRMAEKKFIKKYVLPFQDEVPRVLDANSDVRLFSKRKWLELAKFPANSSILSCSSIPAIDHRNFSSEMSSLVGSHNSASVSSSTLERLKSLERPKMVRQFLRNCKFSESQVDSIVSRWPLIQLTDPEKTLKPKIDYFHYRGLTEEDVIKIVCAEPRSLARSVEKYMIPLFDLLRSVIRSEAKVAIVMKTYPFIFRSNIREALESNLATLRECGVPDTEVSKLVFRRPKAITVQPSRFLEATAKVKELGFDPAGPRFGHAITVISWCSKAAWEGKMQTLRSYGLSDKEIYMGFRILPLFMLLKEPNIKAKMDFFITALNWSPSKLMVAPSILMSSLEERTICRLSVLHCLASKGLVKEVRSVQLFLKMAEKKFVEKFVLAFQDEVPRVLDAHSGKWRVHDWSSFDINTVFKRNVYVADNPMKPL